MSWFRYFLFNFLISLSFRKATPKGLPERGFLSSLKAFRMRLFILLWLKGSRAFERLLMVMLSRLVLGVLNPAMIERA